MRTPSHNSPRATSACFSRIARYLTNPSSPTATAETPCEAATGRHARQGDPAEVVLSAWAPAHSPAMPGTHDTATFLPPNA
jgi:hypothetical protein